MGGQGGCERRIKVFVKIKKNKNWGVGGGSGWWGGQGGCDRRIKVFVKIQKKNIFFFFGGGGRGGGRGQVGGSGWWFRDSVAQNHFDPGLLGPYNSAHFSIRDLFNVILIFRQGNREII